MARKRRLTVVKPTDASPDSPPATLGKAGASLWQSITADHDVRDAGRRAMLIQICCAADRLAECAAIVETDGPIVDGKFGPKEHPLIRVEMTCRGFIVRGLQRLGVGDQKKKAMGRPSIGACWVPPELR